MIGEIYSRRLFGPIILWNDRRFKIVRPLDIRALVILFSRRKKNNLSTVLANESHASTYLTRYVAYDKLLFRQFELRNR